MSYTPKEDLDMSGDPTAPTNASADSDTSVATTAFVHSVFAGAAPLVHTHDIDEINQSGADEYSSPIWDGTQWSVASANGVIRTSLGSAFPAASTVPPGTIAIAEDYNLHGGLFINNRGLAWQHISSLTFASQNNPTATYLAHAWGGSEKYNYVHTVSSSAILASAGLSVTLPNMVCKIDGIDIYVATQHVTGLTANVMNHFWAKLHYDGYVASAYSIKVNAHASGESNAAYLGFASAGPSTVLQGKTVTPVPTSIQGTIIDNTQVVSTGVLASSSGAFNYTGTAYHMTGDTIVVDPNWPILVECSMGIVTRESKSVSPSPGDAVYTVLDTSGSLTAAFGGLVLSSRGHGGESTTSGSQGPVFFRGEIDPDVYNGYHTERSFGLKIVNSGTGSANHRINNQSRSFSAVTVKFGGIGNFYVD